MALANVIATDILSDDINFKPLEDTTGKPSGNGRNRILKAQQFGRVNRLREVLEAQIYDWVITGVCYGWVGKVDEGKLKSAVRQSVKMTESAFYKSNNGTVANQKLSINQSMQSQGSGLLTEGEVDQIYERMTNGEISSLAKKLRHIPATTMNIKNSEYDTVQYVQRVNGRYKLFDPMEVIQIDMMPLDGRPYPYSPFEAILSEVYLLWLITQNHLSFFENGGSPDKAFILPKELSGSQNHRYLIETLKKYKKIQNKHGNLVFTGDLSIEDLQNMEASMEHRELGLYLVGIVAMMLGVPAGRIPFLIGKSANLGDSGGLADSGYWRKISVWQTKFEESYNQSLWEPYFGVRMEFARQYKQDEIREVQIAMDMNAIAEQRMQMGLWSIEDAAEYLSIDPDKLEEAQRQKDERDQQQADMQASMKSGLLQQGRNTKSNVQDEPDEKFKNQKRQSTQLMNNNKSKGKNITP